MSGLGILLVEDSNDDIEVMRRLIRRMPGSYRVEVAYSAAEAITRATTTAFDLAIVDQHLPDDTGERLLARLHESVPELPVVMLTRQGDERLAVEVMKAGAYDYLRKEDLTAPLLHRTLCNAIERAQLKCEIERANARLREWAIRDGLTGLFNHRHFQELLLTEFARAKRYGQPLACLMVDIDHFKQANDTYGHPFGDQVLQRLAAILLAEARKVDVTARYGGEEFVLILPATDAAGAKVVAERICAQVAATPITHDGATIAVTLSIGVSTTEDERCGSERELVKLADAALYRAKRTGRNRVCMAREPKGQVAIEVAALAPQNTGIREFEGEARRLALHALMSLAERSDRNDGFGEHTSRCVELSLGVGRELLLDVSELECLRIGAALHDIGRCCASDGVWTQTSPVTPEQMARVRMHPIRGASMLACLPYLERERAIVRHHHERWDGQGYPDGLSGEHIPQGARIVAVCDAYDALSSNRAWRPAFDAGSVLAHLQVESGQAFDPAVVDALLRILKNEISDTHPTFQKVSRP
ncbi:MAG: diguanylate cyclase [Myxococcales bacterium]|nr:diguanylate cyclase [Myxococcales bacterium]